MGGGDNLHGKEKSREKGRQKERRQEEKIIFFLCYHPLPKIWRGGKENPVSYFTERDFLLIIMAYLKNFSTANGNVDPLFSCRTPCQTNRREENMSPVLAISNKNPHQEIYFIAGKFFILLSFGKKLLFGLNNFCLILAIKNY